MKKVGVFIVLSVSLFLFNSVSAETGDTTNTTTEITVDEGGILGSDQLQGLGFDGIVTDNSNKQLDTQGILETTGEPAISDDIAEVVDEPIAVNPIVPTVPKVTPEVKKTPVVKPIPKPTPKPIVKPIIKPKYKPSQIKTGMDLNVFFGLILLLSGITVFYNAGKRQK